jgi:hypothetical protein
MYITTQLQMNQAVVVRIKLEKIGTGHLNNKKDDAPKFDFDSLFLEALDSTFSMLGDSNKQALYFHLKNSFGISREEIPQNIQVFANTLEQLFGQRALLLEAQIMEALHNKVPCFRLYLTRGELSFMDYLQSFRCFLYMQRHRKKF